MPKTFKWLMEAATSLHVQLAWIPSNLSVPVLRLFARMLLDKKHADIFLAVLSASNKKDRGQGARELNEVAIRHLQSVQAKLEKALAETTGDISEAEFIAFLKRKRDLVAGVIEARRHGDESIFLEHALSADLQKKPIR